MTEDPVVINIIIEALEILTEFFERETNSSPNQFVTMMCETGIASKIEDLQSHESDQIYKKVMAFMEKYFDCENK